MAVEIQKQIYLISGFNKAYLKKSEPYMKTMNENSNVNNVIVTLDFDVDGFYKNKYDSIRFVKVHSSQIKSRNPNTCMQHGGFLAALDFVNADDIIIFTDTDINVQRSFGESELNLMRDLEDGEVLVNYNNPSEDFTLLDETGEIVPNVSSKDLVDKYPEFSKFKSFNTGVIITNYKTYQGIYERYNQYWPDFSLLFDSYVKQQLLLCYVIQKYFKVTILPYLIHSHARSQPVVKCSIKERVGYMREACQTSFKLCIGSEAVAFNHHIKDVKELTIKNLQKKLKKQIRTTVLISLFWVLMIVIILFNKR